jgi:hypothetical protein
MPNAKTLIDELVDEAIDFAADDVSNVGHLSDRFRAILKTRLAGIDEALNESNHGKLIAACESLRRDMGLDEGEGR